MAINKELMKKICRENIPLTKEEYETMSKDMTEEEKEKVFEWAVDSDGNFKYHYVIEPDDNELDTAILFKMYKEQTKYLKSIKKCLNSLLF